MSKALIINHPLFPLLTILHHKCELAIHSRPPIDSLNEDILEVTNQIIDNVPSQHCATNDETSDFMLQAIQILRFHLLELDKVHELCDDFCQRYINLLKSKMSLNLSIDESQSEDESLLSNEDIKPMYFSPIGMQEYPESDPCEENDDVTTPACRQKKRGLFPKSATMLMRAWLFQHLHHPYPSEEEKRLLAQQTKLNILQVNNWFINARRRIVQPMIDQSNRAATMGGDYHDFTTNHPYHSIDPYRTPYGLQINMHDETARMSPYCSIPPAMPSNSYSSTAPMLVGHNAFLSTQCEMPSLSIREPTSMNY